MLVTDSEGEGEDGSEDGSDLDLSGSDLLEGGSSEEEEEGSDEEAAAAPPRKQQQQQQAGAKRKLAAAAAPGSGSEDEDEEASSSESEEDEEEDEEGGVAPASKSALKREMAAHKAQLEALRERDPEFYAYLQVGAGAGGRCGGCGAWAGPVIAALGGSMRGGTAHAWPCPALQAANPCSPLPLPPPLLSPRPARSLPTRSCWPLARTRTTSWAARARRRRRRRARRAAAARRAAPASPPPPRPPSSAAA